MTERGAVPPARAAHGVTIALDAVIFATLPIDPMDSERRTSCALAGALAPWRNAFSTIRSTQHDGRSADAVSGSPG